MKIQHIVEYKLKKQAFRGFSIIKIYYVGDDKTKLRMRTIYKNLSYSEAEQKIYTLDNKIK